MDQFPDIHTQLAYLLKIYENSIGDIDPPIYNIWSTELENEPILAKFMIYLGWLVWISNQFICLIILLNFLIAVIS